MDPTGHVPTDGADPLADVDTYTGLHEAQEHALVILAMNQPCWVVESMPGGGYVLRADPEALPGIRREIDAYDAEQRRTVPIRDASAEPALYPAAGWVALVWSIVLAAVFFWQQVDPKLVRDAASSSTGLIDHGEWWRPFTALFLHADVAHLVGNLFGGALFGVLASRMLGAVRAWPLILLSGAVGNACTSWLTHPAEFSSIGASTAVFAALGLLSGSGFVSLMRIDVKLSLLRLTAPIIGGIALLGWMGGSSPGSNTDVLGHVTGFVCGLFGGVLCGWLPRGSNAR